MLALFLVFPANGRPAQELCLGIKGEDCNNVAVIATHGACSSIATAAGVTMAKLLENNPNLNKDCSNGYVGMVRCNYTVRVQISILLQVLCVARDLYNYTVT